jgi:pyridoxine kinase
MNDKRILTVQDISCVGQCSLTVALPIISACGIETAVLPSAVLSNHTAFPDFTFNDLTEEMPKIESIWKKENIKFSALYTGYLGNARQVHIVKNIIKSCIDKGGLKIVDPAMADSGKLYAGFDMDYVDKMKALCKEADIILPNITEACLMTDTEYNHNPDKDYIEELILKLRNIFSGKIILTGVGFSEDKTGIAVFDGNSTDYYQHIKVGMGGHGTGDLYASAFVGALVRGKSLFDAAKIAADLTVMCIENTVNDPEHWYGVKFEGCLGKLIDILNNI